MWRPPTLSGPFRVRNRHQKYPFHHTSGILLFKVTFQEWDLLWRFREGWHEDKLQIAPDGTGRIPFHYYCLKILHESRADSPLLSILKPSWCDRTRDTCTNILSSMFRRCFAMLEETLWVWGIHGTFKVGASRKLTSIPVFQTNVHSDPYFQHTSV